MNSSSLSPTRSTTMIFRVLTLFLSVTLVSSAIIDAATFANITFDFIIAGGGTAGVAVAVR